MAGIRESGQLVKLKIVAEVNVVEGISKKDKQIIGDKIQGLLATEIYGFIDRKAWQHYHQPWETIDLEWILDAEKENKT